MIQRRFPKRTFTARTLRAFHSRADQKEYFIAVWDKAGSDRSKINQCDLAYPVYTFVGEILTAHAAANPEINGNESVAKQVIGNAFACRAENVEEVKEKMKTSAYYTKSIWDMSTAQISPLEVVHTSTLNPQQS